MSIELLSILGEKEQYDRYCQFINREVVEEECYTIIKDLKDYYKHSGEETVDWSGFDSWFRVVKHSSWKREKLDTFSMIFRTLDGYTATGITESIVEKFVLQDYCQQIADISLKGSEGEDVDISDIENLVEKYKQESNRVTDLEGFFVTDDIHELVSNVYDGGYKWRMEFLNRSVGNLRQGKLVCVAARPNTCKTTFLASEATFVASQLENDQCVLWFNNEEEGSDVKMRIVQAGIGWTSEDIHLDPKGAKEEFEKLVGPLSKIKVVNKADINTKDCEEFMRTHDVGLIIFDQLWKVHGFEKQSGTDTVRLGNIFQWAREMAKKYAPVITVHQVKTEGEGVEYLQQSMLYLSGTVIQGEVDTLVMIGRNYIPGQEKNRYINIVKNKGAYGPDVDPTLKEGKAMIELLAETAQFKECGYE